jgi:hypothetical protein
MCEVDRSTELLRPGGGRPVRCRQSGVAAIARATAGSRSAMNWIKKETYFVLSRVIIILVIIYTGVVIGIQMLDEGIMRLAQKLGARRDQAP